MNLENIKNWINEKDFDIEYGETTEGIPCFVADWNDFPRLDNMFSIMERCGHHVSLLWSDTYLQCSNCYSYLSSTPAYYRDEVKGLWVSDCDFFCADCVKEFIEDVIEYYQNDYTKAIPSWVIDDVKEQGFICLDQDEVCARFEHGWHPGQNDKPEEIIKQLESKGELDDYD